MHNDLFFVLGLLFIVCLLVMLAKKLRIAYPIFLVIAGLGISFIPGMPVVELDPDLVFLIFLPPLLYEAAWYTSWNDFWKWKRPIALMGFGLVFLTSVVIAYTSVALIPGFTLALGFLLGGIVSPPDAVAAATVLKGTKVPKRLLTILEGESLVNDAASLIVFRFALAAVLTGTFSFQEATGRFFMVAGMGIVVGLVIAHIAYFIHRYLPTVPAIDAVLTVMTPYVLFLAAEHFHFSGVMAVVTGGLFLSYRSHEIFQTGNTRLNMVSVWGTLIFAMNALVFILIGLELPVIIQGLGDYSVADGIYYGLLISGIAILIRYLWTYPIAHIPRWVSAKARQDPSPGWKGPFIIGWAGMRGVVSLATALSIPLLLMDGNEFPQRNLIIFITFVVIFVTLVFQGITLPLIVKWIKLDEIDNVISEEEQQAGIRLRLKKASLVYLKENYAEAIKSNELLTYLKSDTEADIKNLKEQIDLVECGETDNEEIEEDHNVMIELFAVQRKELFQLRKEKHFSDEEIRKAEMQVDLNELKITGVER